MSQQTTSQLQLAYDFVQSTREHIFLTGKAGTGKTTFLHDLKKKSLKRMIVVAPTGVAAINAGGVTIHSFFQLPFGPILPSETQGSSSLHRGSGSSIHRFSRAKIDIIRSLDLLVIDEISMVRADLLDGVDAVLRRYRRNSQPFGDVQLLMIGDMHQLAPVLRDEDWEKLKEYYSNGFFFSSRALQSTRYLTIELKTIFRQNDPAFITLLNDVRDGHPSDETLSLLNKRYNPAAASNEDIIMLTTHNHQANTINQSRMAALSEKEYIFHATVRGEFPESSYPADPALVLKRGAKVMFTRNDSSGLREYYNGKIGYVTELSDDEIKVRCPEDEYDIEVHTECWENIKYDIDEETKEIKEQVLGEFHHYPLKLAWAITIHKSQGLTFDNVVIDARAAFAFGQVYVALSRCRSLQGLYLSSPVNRNCIKSDSEIIAFSRESIAHEPGMEELERSRIAYRKYLFEELFGYQPMERGLKRLHKLISENEGSFSKALMPALEEMTTLFRREIADVSVKFLAQLSDLTDQYGRDENHEFTQSRIMKACAYFSEKQQQLLKEKLGALPLETDNRELMKSVNDLSGLMTAYLLYKKRCMESCKEGFRLYEYLQARAKATLEEREPSERPVKDNEKTRNDLKNPALYKLLREWRNRKAAELRKDPAKVIRGKLLEEISDAMPLCTYDLTAIKGFGPQKRKMFAAEILRIVVDYLKSTGQAIPEQETPGTRYRGNTGVSTDQLSYDMFTAGLSPLDIAEERGLALSTIEGHLARFVAKGILDARKLVDEQKFQPAYEYFSKHPLSTTSDARLVLGDGFSYSELRMVLAQVKSEKQPG